jgi:hypothetical protein
MKVLDFFRRRRSAPAEEAEDRERTEWSIVRAHNETTNELAVFRVRFSQPARSDLSLLRTAIVIKWKYGSDVTMPSEKVTRAQYGFEEALDPLAESENSELVHVSTGMGQREWIYYARDQTEFMRALNSLLRDHPPYPLTIEFYDDPDWLVWSDMVDPLRDRV